MHPHERLVYFLLSLARVIRRALLIPSVWILVLAFLFIQPASFAADLDLEPVHLFKCWRALKKLNTRQTPTIPKSFNDNSIGLTPLLSRLEPQDLAQSSDSPWGGIVYRGVEGTPTVLFWPEHSKAIEFKEVVGEILKSELRALDGYLENPRNEKLELLKEMKSNLDYLVSELKKSEQIPDAISERFYGFLIHADKGTGSPKIKSIDFDLDLLKGSQKRVLFGWTEEVESMLQAIGKAVSPKIKPEVYRLNTLFFDSYLGPHAVKAPSGSRLEKLPD